jgi:hypothetical protein
MFKVDSRADLAPLTGKPRPAPPKPDPAPGPTPIPATPAAPTVTPETLAGIVEASRQMVVAAHMMVDAVQHVAKPEKLRQLEATIVRDSAGKMAKVVIKVT